jgi:hypothetical protein
VFQSIHDNDPDPKLLAYQYLQTLPQLAQGPGNTVWMVPSELTGALKMLSSAFEGAGGGRDAAAENGQSPVGQLPRAHRAEVPRPAGPAQVEAAPNGTDPAPATAEAAPASADPASASAEAGAASEGASAGAVAAADAELAAAMREAARDAAQVGGAQLPPAEPDLP